MPSRPAKKGKGKSKGASPSPKPKADWSLHTKVERFAGVRQAAALMTTALSLTCVPSQVASKSAPQGPQQTWAAGLHHRRHGCSCLFYDYLEPLLGVDCRNRKKRSRALVFSRSLAFLIILIRSAAAAQRDDFLSGLPMRAGMASGAGGTEFSACGWRTSARFSRKRTDELEDAQAKNPDLVFLLSRFLDNTYSIRRSCSKR